MLLNKKKLVKNIIIVLLMFCYAAPLLILAPDYSYTFTFFMKVFGTAGFVSLFVIVLTGSFREFFNKHFSPKLVNELHCALGSIVLILGGVHSVYKAWQAGFFPTLALNNVPGVNAGVLAFYALLGVMVTTIVQFYWRSYDYWVWKSVHLLSYPLFFLVYFHAFLIGTHWRSPAMQVLTTAYALIAVAGVVKRTLFYYRLGKKNITK